MKKILLFALLFSTIITNAQCYESLKFGGTHTLGLKSDGTLWGWGFGSYDQLGTVNTTEPNPIQVGTINNFTKFYPGVLNTFIIKNDGTLWGVGSNYEGSLGVNSTTLTFMTFRLYTIGCIRSLKSKILLVVSFR